MREDDILFVIARARRLTEQVCRELTQQSGLRLVELDILYYLSRGHAGDTARDIIGAKHLSKAHISKSVDNLRRTGCVTLREDAADRRCLHLCLTDKGRGVCRPVCPDHAHHGPAAAGGRHAGGTKGGPFHPAKDTPQPGGGNRGHQTGPPGPHGGNQMKSIAIEREFGSGGHEIGVLTAKLLGRALLRRGAVAGYSRAQRRGPGPSPQL